VARQSREGRGWAQLERGGAQRREEDVEEDGAGVGGKEEGEKRSMTCGPAGGSLIGV
jgi:hypothetical protein